MIDLLLINLACKKVYQKQMERHDKYFPSLGLLSIASYVGMHGYSVIVKDYNNEELNYNRLDSLVRENHPRLIGITVYTENANLVCRLSEFLKEISPDSKIMVGGPHASLKPEYFRNYSTIDFVEIGEGETPTLELLEALIYPGSVDIHTIPNLVVNGKNAKRVPLTRIRDLDILPMVNREYADISRFVGQISMYSSKGCPANCIYCAATALSGASFRIRSAENLLLELLTLRVILQMPHIYILFADDTFTAIKPRVRRFSEIVEKNHLKFAWACESRVDVADEELIDLLHKSGCVSMQFGIESGNQEVLDKLRKKINLEHALDVIAYAAKYPLNIHLSFMFGHYCDTVETMDATIDFMKKAYSLNSNVLFAVSYNTPLPGTWQHTHASELGFRFLTRSMIY